MVDMLLMMGFIISLSLSLSFRSFRVFARGWLVGEYYYDYDYIL